MEDEVDLRRYIGVLFRHWKLIVSITAIAVIVAVLFSFLATTRTYEAKAAVLITSTRAQVVFEPNYKTLVPTEDADFKKAIVALVKSSSVAGDVIDQLGDKLEPGERNVTTIQGMVTTSTNGDLIQISVKSADAEKAAAIANAWAKSYESYINGLYSGILLTPEELQVQADAAKKDYQEKQKALENFLGNNSIKKFSDQIADKELLGSITSLREQIAAGSLSNASAAANSLATVLLQAKAFTTLPDQMQLSLESLTSLNASTEQQLHDIDALISTLESRSETQPGQTIDELRQEILQLQEQLGQQNAEEKELGKSTDIAWNTYTTLETKVAEIGVASQAQDATVRVAAPATVPQTPLSAATHKTTNIGIALVLGLVVGVFAAFGVEYFKNTGEKPRDAEPRSVKEEPGSTEDKE